MTSHTISLYLKEWGHEVFGFDSAKSLYVDSIAGDARDTVFLTQVIEKFDAVINSTFDPLTLYELYRERLY